MTSVHVQMQLRMHECIYKRLFVWGIFTYQEGGNSSDFIILAVTVIHVGNVRSCSHGLW